ncbi:MAG: hypothetical protein CMH54_06675 [Myxococcales bacterium]|nr:hypothetical protein [Myxococcales bacterium]|tara:strand:+ start:3041 stop:3991 length:951 start_codon:yes stop_codon:yes gene_type:complete
MHQSPPYVSPVELAASVVTLGNFDGFHLGHQALVKKVIECADAHGCPSVVLTFDPHPANVLRPEQKIPTLVPIPRRATQLENAGIDHVVVIEFTEELASLSPDEFLETYVLGPLNPVTFVAGPDTRFGKDRAGDTEFLRGCGEKSGFDVIQMDPVLDGGDKISSSGLRRLLRDGEVDRVCHWMGRHYDVYGTVVHGDGRGKTIGVPTANIDYRSQVIPALGVYAVMVQSESNPLRMLRGVANLGLKPTFETPATSAPVLEVHLLDGEHPDLYGQVVRLEFVKKLRDEKRFDGVDALVAQIQMDISAARTVLEGAEV